MKQSMVGVGLVLLLAGALVSAHSFTTMYYFCTECAAGRSEVQIWPFGMRSLGTLTSKDLPSKWTKLVEAVDLEPCTHRWILVRGAGGSFS